MLEKYLQQTTHNYTIHSTFKKDNMEHIVATEFSPTGKESDFFILKQDGNQIFNDHGTLVGIINGNEIEVVEM